MLFALIDNVKTVAIPKTNAICPLCNEKVLSKCGEINVWHWAHTKKGNCDNWQESETKWHKDWKEKFGKNFSEVIISKNGKKHIVDILTKEKVVIELQNSPILKPVIRKREEFYGDKMFWIINGEKFKYNFTIYSYDYENESSHLEKVAYDLIKKLSSKKNKKSVEKFLWKWNRKSWDEVQRNVFIDFGEENLFWVKKGMGKANGSGVYVSKADFLNKYNETNTFKQ